LVAFALARTKDWRCTVLRCSDDRGHAHVLRDGFRQKDEYASRPPPSTLAENPPTSEGLEKGGTMTARLRTRSQSLPAGQCRSSWGNVANLDDLREEGRSCYLLTETRTTSRDSRAVSGNGAEFGSSRETSLIHPRFSRWFDVPESVRGSGHLGQQRRWSGRGSSNLTRRPGRAIALQLSSVFLCCKAAVPVMSERGAGRS